MINSVARNEGRNDNRRDARAILIERETLAVGTLELRFVSRGSCPRRGHVIVKTPVLVPGNDEHARLPDGRVTDRVVGGLNESFTPSDTVERVLGVATDIIARDMPIVRLDPGELAG